MAVTESPYRTTSDIISSTCGQSISAGGVWNLMQRLGERISEEENYVVKQMNADQSEGKKEIPVLFEEMDGVWLSMQDKNHKKMKKQKMKVFTMYEGWDAEKEKQNRSTIVGKTMLAEIEECFRPEYIIRKIPKIYLITEYLKNKRTEMNLRRTKSVREYVSQRPIHELKADVVHHRKRIDKHY